MNTNDVSCQSVSTYISYRSEPVLKDTTDTSMSATYLDIFFDIDID